MTAATAGVTTAEQRTAAADEMLSAAAALAAVTLAAGLTMGRLFQGTRHVLPVVVAVAVAHGVSLLGRRRSWPAPLVGLAGGAGVLLAAVWVVVPHTTGFGFPGRRTVQYLQLELATSWQQYAEVVAPVPPREGFLVAAMVGIGLAALLADWAAFRIGGTLEALIPPLAVFVFVSALGGTGGRGLSTVLFVGAALLFVVVHHAAVRAGTADWFAGNAAGAVPRLLQAGALVGALAIAAAVIVGPNLPGAERPPLVGWRDEGPGRGGGGRTTVSPLVDIRGRLVDGSDAPVFTVQSNVRSYWRLMSLDTFDGAIWSAQNSYDPVDERLPSGVPSAATTETAVQEFDISGLASIWLPAAFRPVRLEGGGDVRFDPDSGSLITDEETSDALRYTVESSIPRFEAGALNAAPPVLGGRDIERYLALPALSPRVLRLARLLAPADATPYEQARGIQDYFRENYTYDLDAPPGHGGNAVEQFLFESRRGYCEQFAGSFAVLARAVGLPTRVAVGFTPGELGADGRYHVRSLNAHAWPEVFLAGYGWVAFEPTPGRGAPGAEQYTGVPEAQASPENPTTATTGAPTTTTTAAPSTGGTTETTFRDLDDPSSGADTGSGDRRWLRPLVTALVALALLAGAWGAVVPLLHRRRRRAIWAGAVAPPDVILAAWHDVDASLRSVDAAAGHRAAETFVEHGRRVGPVVQLGPELTAALRALAADATLAAYGPDLATAELATTARRTAGSFETWAADSLGRRRRTLRSLDPRPLLRDPERVVHDLPPEASSSSTASPRRTLTRI